MKGVAWDSVGAPQMESAKKAGDLISDVSHTYCKFNTKSKIESVYFVNASSWSYCELFMHIILEFKKASETKNQPTSLLSWHQQSQTSQAIR